MHGPALSPIEVAAVLHGAVARFERLGIGREMAIEAVALDNGLPVDQVAAIISRFAPAPDTEKVS
jgi:hypothetical protein